MLSNLEIILKNKAQNLNPISRPQKEIEVLCNSASFAGICLSKKKQELALEQAPKERYIKSSCGHIGVNVLAITFSADPIKTLELYWSYILPLKYFIKRNNCFEDLINRINNRKAKIELHEIKFDLEWLQFDTRNSNNPIGWLGFLDFFINQNSLDLISLKQWMNGQYAVSIQNLLNYARFEQFYISLNIGNKICKESLEVLEF
jgi:hypothetical protein